MEKKISNSLKEDENLIQNDYKNFKSTKEIKISQKIYENVIGQDEALEIIQKAAKQRRHVLLLGEPGTGKSMLGKAIAEILSTKNALDILSYPNTKDENKPIIKVTKAGDGTKIIDKDKFNQIKNMSRGQGTIAIVFILLSFAFAMWHSYKYYNQLDPLFTDNVYAAWIIADIIIIGFLVLIMVLSSSISKRMLGNNQDANVAKLIVDNSNKKMIFEDASGAHEGALLGDVLHDPFQSGGMGTPAHQRVVAGMIHKANGGVLFIDEIATLKPEMQQELLTAIQEKQMPITGRSERSAGAMVRSTPVPTDFILVAAGNLDTLKHMHPALRSRIRGYGYEIYMNEAMPDNQVNCNKIIQFVAQEVKNAKNIPHFTKSACDVILFEARKRGNKGGKITTRFRELGGIIRAAGDIAVQRDAKLTDKQDVLKAIDKVKSVEQQLILRHTKDKKDYSIINVKGVAIGKVNGLAVMGQIPPYTGSVMSIEAEVARGKGNFVATGKLGEIAKESVTNISALILKIFGEDITKDYSVYIQFIQTHGGVEGDSASIAIATAIVSSLKNIPIKQDVAMTGSLSIRGEVLPIGGVSAKIEGAYNSGIKTVIVPESNLKDIVISDKIRKSIKIVSAKYFDEVLDVALDWRDKNKNIKEKISKYLKNNKVIL